MSAPIIQFRDFGFQYNAQQQPTLYDISLDIRKGEKILIAGPSGCGKSSLLHCINGLIPFSYKGEMTGSLTLNGKETRDLSLFDISKSVGTVLQDSDGQFVGLTVAEDIAFALENNCVPEPDLHRRVLEAAKKVRIEQHLSHAPSELSGGQKQRVSLAGVLVDEVDLLLFDEPLANLDPAAGKQAIELIDDMQQLTGAAVVIVEHRLEDVLWRHVDRIVLLSEGRIVFDGAPDVLLSGSLLTEHGIREPLYLTALKYAGVTVSPEIHPESIRDLSLSESDKAKVCSWFQAVPPAEKKEKGEELFRAEHLNFTYASGHKALSDISVSLRKGELVAIAGSNGAGKSTFSKVLCCFETPQSGIMTYRGEDLSLLSIKERADRIGYVMQNPNQMISKIMIADEVGLGLQTRGVPAEEITRRVGETLKICGLWPFRNWPISALSYGQKKRVTIASILVLEPEMIILDEPTAGQDYRHYTEIMEFLLSLQQRGLTVVMITHDMHLMLEYAERSIVFNDGRIIADAPCAEILTSPEIIRQASLKETSLFDLALRCGLSSGQQFVERFIDYERRMTGRW